MVKGIGKSIRVYVVDDDESVRHSICLLLKAHGCTAVPCDSAQHFLDTWEQDVPSCVLLDIRMPDMSGLDLQDLMNRRGVQEVAERQENIDTLSSVSLGELKAKTARA